MPLSDADLQLPGLVAGSLASRGLVQPPVSAIPDGQEPLPIVEPVGQDVGLLIGRVDPHPESADLRIPAHVPTIALPLIAHLLDGLLCQLYLFRITHELPKFLGFTTRSGVSHQ